MNERNRVPNPIMKAAIVALIAVVIVSVGALGVSLVLTSMTGGAIYDNGSVQNTPMAAGIVLLACIVGGAFWALSRIFKHLIDRETN